MEVVDILRNTPFRLLFIGIPTIFVLLRRLKLKLDYFVIGLIALSLVGEVFTLLHSGYNLVHYSVFMLAEVWAVTFLVFYETRNIAIKWVGICIPLLSFIFFLLTKHSSVSILNITTQFPVRSPMDTHQFFDFGAINSLVIMFMAFVWLHKIVSSTKSLIGGTTKRFIYISGILGYYCGTFFTIAFGRYIVGDITIWFEYWNKIYLPLYLLYYLTLNIGLLWKPAPSPSS